MIYSGNVLEKYPAGTSLEEIVSGLAKEPCTVNSDGGASPFSPYSPNEELSVKLFLAANKTSNDYATQIKRVFQILGSFPVNQFVVHVEGDQFSDDSEDCGHLVDIWQQIVDSSRNHKVESLGVSELSTDKLKALCSQLDARGLPHPSLNQINAEDCCALPPALVRFAKEQKIRLLGHHDPAKFDLSQSFEWILRVNRVLVDRQILSSTEFLIC